MSKAISGFRAFSLYAIKLEASQKDANLENLVEFLAKDLHKRANP